VSRLLQVEREKAQGKYFEKFDFDSLSLDTLNVSRFSGHKVSLK
jgi:hypothetical protein